MTGASSALPEPDADAAPPASLTNLFLLAGHLLELRLDQALSSQGLTARQHRVLRLVADNPGVTRIEVASALCVSRQAAGGLSQRLCNAGLLERTYSGPGLPVSYVITARGHLCLNASTKIIAAAERATVEDMSTASLESLVTTVRNLIEHATAWLPTDHPAQPDIA